MGLFDSVVVTSIEKPFTFFTDRGRVQVMENRPSCCLAFCNSGQITYTQDKLSYTLTTGQALLLAQGSTYTIHGNKRSVVSGINFNCTGIHSNDIVIFKLSDLQKHIVNYNRLSELFALPDKRLSIFSIFYDMLHQVNADEALTLNPLRALLDYIERHIGDPSLNNIALAEKMGVSEVYLRRLFVAHCGTSPKQYILDLRVEKAKQLLSDHLYTVTEVAEKCGFSSVYHFCRVFKQRTGMTPSEYAAQHVVYKI